MAEAAFTASGPEIRMTPIPPLPGGVEMAAMVSVCMRCSKTEKGEGRSRSP
jgi:hypothetical protein